MSGSDFDSGLGCVGLGWVGGRGKVGARVNGMEAQGGTIINDQRSL